MCVCVNCVARIQTCSLGVDHSLWDPLSIEMRQSVQESEILKKHEITLNNNICPFVYTPTYVCTCMLYFTLYMYVPYV